MSPERLPRWEGDFWAELMEEQGVFMDDRPMGTTTVRFATTGGPDAFFYADRIPQEPFESYDNGNVIVGEIVEDEQLELTDS